MCHDTISPCTHHLLLIVQHEGFFRLLPQSQGLVVGTRHDKVATGTDSQTPHLRFVALATDDNR